MKVLVCLFCLFFSIGSFAQEKDAFQISIADSDIEKLSEHAQKISNLAANNICGCIQEHQTIFDDLVTTITDFIKIKDSGNETEIEKAKTTLNQSMQNAMPFLICNKEKSGNSISQEDKDKHSEELKKLYPEYADSEESISILKSKFGLYYMKENCKEDYRSFELFNAFAFGMSKGKKTNKNE